jgi:hypothetical protein
VIEDKPYVEGTCISDPCWYNVTGATGKEVIILDLYEGTGKLHRSSHCVDGNNH